MREEGSHGAVRSGGPSPAARRVPQYSSPRRRRRRSFVDAAFRRGKQAAILRIRRTWPSSRTPFFCFSWVPPSISLIYAGQELRRKPTLKQDVSRLRVCCHQEKRGETGGGGDQERGWRFVAASFHRPEDCRVVFVRSAHSFRASPRSCMHHSYCARRD